MACNRLSPRGRGGPRYVGLVLGAAWVGAAMLLLLPSVVDADFGEAGRRLEERLERQIQHGPEVDVPYPPPSPQREDPEAIEPWELVRV